MALNFPQGGLWNHQDRLNRMNPAAAQAGLGDIVYNLINQLNGITVAYNNLLAHLDTANATGIGNANAATYGITTTVPLPPE